MLITVTFIDKINVDMLMKLILQVGVGVILYEIMNIKYIFTLLKMKRR